MFPYGNVDHDCKACCMDDGIYSCIWSESGWRCEIFYDNIMLYNVGMQILPVCISDPCNGIWPDGSMDRNVCGLDGQKYYFHLAIPQQKMAGA